MMIRKTVILITFHFEKFTSTLLSFKIRLINGNVGRKRFTSFEWVSPNRFFLFLYFFFLMLYEGRFRSSETLLTHIPLR